MKYSRILFVLVLVLGALSLGTSYAESPRVHVLNVDGTIVPVIADYIDRGITDAEKDDASAVVIVLKTPGGMLSTTEDIVDLILESEVPVVVYVDRWAGSAGTFITLAAHVAAMAPASRIGAASPVSGGGEEIGETLEEKIKEDTAASIRSLADLRGRNQKAAEATVVDALSFTVQEALGIAPLSKAHQEVMDIEEEYLDPPLVDLGAENIEDLIEQIDGMTVEVDGEEVTIHTKGYRTQETGMNLMERFLHAISDPNIAYILLSIGSLGLILELYSPGTIFPGVVGAISLLLAFYSLSVLNAYWAGVILVMLGFALFVAEVFTTSFGLLTAGGIAALVIGSVILFSGGPSMDGLGIDWWAVTIVVVCVVAFFTLVIGAVVRTQRRKQPTGADGLIGTLAEVKTVLNPKGTVFIHGELWAAIIDEGQADPGEEVTVTDVTGLKLRVTRKK